MLADGEDEKGREELLRRVRAKEAHGRIREGGVGEGREAKRETAGERHNARFN